jgi:hypothetical protein
VKNKNFDCVQMKWDIQRKQREAFAGVPESEQRRILMARVAADPILGPLLLRAHQVQTSPGRE